MIDSDEGSHDEASKDTTLPSSSPDFVEQDEPDLIDNIIPTRGYQLTPMVGLGGSAGSIQALGEFFKAMPNDSGMVFVVILHLSATHHSSLPEVLTRSTAMAVTHAVDGIKVKANHIYVIPPGKHLATTDGHLKLTNINHEHGKRVAVDIFFRSLADTHGPHATAIVLSGADGDGAIGIKRIKERGGLTIAQDPDQAEHASMPRTSIETGMVDWVLPVGQIPEKLCIYQNNEKRLKLPPEDGPPLEHRPNSSGNDGENALREILLFLRLRSGCDFSFYKRATILRRIKRRMQVNNVETLDAYLEFLRTHAGEAGALLQDFLISVTNFFRDREVFDALTTQIESLFLNKKSDDTIRVWCPACATGEEAYSIAMLLQEQAHKIQNPPSLQIFACDLDEDAVQIARSGSYPDAIAADVSEERLQRFFVKDQNGYKVRRELREIILFAFHDLLRDPPFSRMDMISCRNLFIYLTPNAQRRVFEIFHFAMKSDALLLLGASESIENGGNLFRTVDKKNRIYASLPSMQSNSPMMSDAHSLQRVVDKIKHTASMPVIHGKHFGLDRYQTLHQGTFRGLDRSALAELHFKLIERYAPPSIIVNTDHDIVHLSEHAGEFLKITGGEPTMNLMRVINPALRIELRTTLFRAAESHELVRTENIPVPFEGEIHNVTVEVTQIFDISPDHLLVTFKKSGPLESFDSGQDAAHPQASSRHESALRHLENELEQLKQNLRDTVEQYEASGEELRASNEELQAMNEELQSINEELSTVNSEMKVKVDEIASANSDLQNLMASTSIATVFLDRKLAIMRYTPSAAGIFNLIPGDIGRPLAHLKHTLEYPNLIEDAKQVLQTLIPHEREVRDEKCSYVIRLQPYRTMEDTIAGAVLTLFDVTERNKANEALRQSEERLRILIESVKDYAIFTTDTERRIDGWNKGAETIFGFTESEILGKTADILFTTEDCAKGDPVLEMNTARDLGRAENERWHARKDKSTFYGSGSVMPLRDKSGELRGFVKIMRDLTERKRAQEALREHVEELTRFNAAAVGRESRMIELKTEINALLLRLGEPAKYTFSPQASYGESLFR